MLHAGRLNNLVKIQKRTGAKDAYGQETERWTDIAEVWANIKPISGREQMRFGTLGTTLTHTVATHYRNDLDLPMQAGAWRIQYGSRMLNINSCFSLDEAHQWLIFNCTEGAINGH